MEINDRVKMRDNTDCWNKGEIGRIVKVRYNMHNKPIYLVCFDSNCHEMHDVYEDSEHCWWTDKTDVAPGIHNELMEVK